MRKGVLMTCAVLMAAVTSPHTYAQSTTSFVPYSTANRGAVVIETLGGTEPLLVGYGRVLPASSSAPAGFAIIGYEQNGVLVSETGVPGTGTITSGRTYAEINGAINTGVAFLNPSSTPVVVSFHFTNLAGVDSGFGTFTLNGNAQTAKFLNEAPFNMTSFTGSFTFTAPGPVAVISLRTFVNERNEFLAAAQTVVPLPSASSAGTLMAAHFVDGGGWRTQLILINPTDSSITGTVQFFGEGSATVEATPLTLTVNGSVGSTFNYTIPAKSAAPFETSAPAGTVRTGSVRISATGGTTPPAAFEVLSLTSGGVTVSQASIQAQFPATVFRSYVEMRDATAETDRIQSAIAIANNSATNATVNFELTAMDGTSTGLTASVNIAGFGHVSKFVQELFPGIDLPFQGVLRISSFNSIAVSALRTRNNRRGTFLITTTPVSNEVGVSTTADLFFPQIADRAGYTTQFILFSGIVGQSTTGTLRFLKQDGQDLSLLVR